MLLQPPFPGCAVEPRWRKGRNGGGDRLQGGGHRLLRQQRVGHQHLAGLQTRQLRGEIPRRHGHDRKVAGGDVRPGESHFAGRLHPRQGGQIVVPRGFQKVVLGERTRGDEPHHLTAHHGLGAALLRLRRILHLLADGDPVAGPDQLVQVFLRGMHRHAAHGDVLTGMLAPFRQSDAETAGGDFGIVEEQLVEVAHAIEEQIARVGRLQLQILRHGRRGLRRRAVSALRHDPRFQSRISG